MPTYELRSQKTGRTYEVDFTHPPSDGDIDEAINQFDSGQQTQSNRETPGYLSQLGGALGLGYRQMKSGLGATFNAYTGDTQDVAESMAEMNAQQQEQARNATPEDVALNQEFAEHEAKFDRAHGFFPSAKALGGYVSSAISHPGAAFKQAVQSAPNALIGGATELGEIGRAHV